MQDNPYQSFDTNPVGSNLGSPLRIVCLIATTSLAAGIAAFLGIHLLRPAAQAELRQHADALFEPNVVPSSAAINSIAVLVYVVNASIATFLVSLVSAIVLILVRQAAKVSAFDSGPG